MEGSGIGEKAPSRQRKEQAQKGETGVAWWVWHSVGPWARGGSESQVIAPVSPSLHPSLHRKLVPMLMT